LNPALLLLGAALPVHLSTALVALKNLAIKRRRRIAGVRGLQAGFA